MHGPHPSLYYLMVRFQEGARWPWEGTLPQGEDVGLRLGGLWIHRGRAGIQQGSLMGLGCFVKSCGLGVSLCPSSGLRKLLSFFLW